MNELKTPTLDALSNDAGDAAERCKAWDVEQSWIVEAPAGSGKTELLMQRFLLLLSRVEQPEQILAITFTRKATAEMRDRILESLRDAKRDDTLPDHAAHKLQTREFARQALENDAMRGWNLLSQPQRLNIRTIDSLCGEIVSQLPLLSQFGGQLRPAESTAALYRKAAQSALEKMGGSDQRLRQAAGTLLLHLDNRLDDTVDLLAEMLDTRDQWGRIFPIDRDLSDQELNLYMAERLEKPLQEAVDSSLAEISTLAGSEFLAQAFELGNHAAQVLESSGRKNILRPLLGGPSIPPATHEYLDCWKSLGHFLLTDKKLRSPRGVNISLGFATNDEKKPLFLNLLRCAHANAEIIEKTFAEVIQLPPCFYDQSQKEILRASFLLLRQAVAHLKVAFAESGSADFTEFLLAANEALRSDSSSLALTFGAKILHLLVDEMQDTSVSQIQLLSKLVESWDGYSQTVFLVGDPKQSIYRFRNAEVGLFTQAQKEGLGGVVLQPIQLSSNFRSRQSLVEQTNAIFSKIFDAKSERDTIEFTPAEAAHKEDQVQRVFWHSSVHKYKSKQKENDPNASLPIEDTQIEEAREVCDVIEHSRASVPEGQPHPSIAILIRARSHVGPILREMRKRRIPYHAVEMDTLADRQPLLDLAAITRCLLHPADRIAWLAVLRAPWCGITLSDLLVLCGSDDGVWNDKTVAELFRERATTLSADGQRRAERTLQILEAAQKASSHGRLAMLVERAWRTLGGPECVPKAEIPSAMEFFRMLGRLEDEGGWPSANTLEDQMRKLFAASDRVHNSPVEVLTLFKAKGLEWDIVLMPSLHRCTQGERKKLIEWMEQISDGDQADNSILLAPVKHVADETEPIGTWVRSRILERNRTELKRVLYVGCTRARRELHLFGQCWEGKSGALNLPKDRSLLQTAWPVAEAIFRDQMLQSNAPSEVVEMPLRTAADEEFPAPSPGILDTVAAKVDVAPEIPGTIRLSNFQRLAAGWKPLTVPPDVPLGSSANEIAREIGQADEAPFTRPQGSWRARVFGTILHAFLEPLAEILRRHEDGAAISEAIGQLAHPIRLQLQRAGHVPKEADREARRIVGALKDMTGDKIARWLLTASPKSGSQPFSGFEVPLTAFIHDSIRSIRVDRMFPAGGSPLAPGEDFLWIVDFKTAGYGADRMDEFLDEQKALNSAQMRTYAEAAQTICPERKEIRLGLYYPLLGKLVWWQHEGQSSRS